MQDQAFLAAKVCLAAVEDVADRLATHAAQGDRRDPVSRLDRRQAIGLAYGDPLRLATLAHGAFGRVERRQRHLAGHRRCDDTTAHQRHRQVAVIRADIGQARPDGHMRRHALQAHGQCLFVQLQPLFHRERPAPLAETEAILSGNAVHFKSMRQGRHDC